MVGPATKTQVEIGLNVKGLAGGGRLTEQKPGGMCRTRSESVPPKRSTASWWPGSALPTTRRGERRRRLDDRERRQRPRRAGMIGSR